jgi:RNA polymerase subunit RPABC4/transcription elongation factor Spt4
LPPSIPIPKREHLCRGCGKTIESGRVNCARCAVDDATKNMLDAALIGRQTAHSPVARAKQANTQRRNVQAQYSWEPSSQPSWLTNKFYSEKVQPLLAAMSSSAIARQISVSRWYAGRIRQGHRPHPRHWKTLAKLVGVSANKSCVS